MPYLHSAFTVGVAVMLQTIVTGWWTKFKARQALQPQAMKLRGGVYVSWGPVQKIEVFLKWEFRFGMTLLGFWVLALIYALLFDPSLIGRAAH